MYAGVAAGLLVFAGFWRATEFLMAGRSDGTVRLVPIGVVYLLLGVLIISTFGNAIVLWVSLFVVLTGLLGTYLSRNKTEVRSWVVWTFLVTDAAIAACLARALFF